MSLRHAVRAAVEARGWLWEATPSSLGYDALVTEPGGHGRTVRLEIEDADHIPTATMKAAQRRLQRHHVHVELIRDVADLTLLWRPARAGTASYDDRQLGRHNA